MKKMEDTKSTIIVCHESGEQFTPTDFVVAYRHNGKYEGIWKVRMGSSQYERLEMISKMLEGAYLSFVQVLNDLEKAHERLKDEGVNHD